MSKTTCYFKTVLLALTLAMLLALAACGGGAKDGADNTSALPDGTGSAEEAVIEESVTSETESDGDDEIVPGKRVDRVVNPSELLGTEDATQIFGQDFNASQQDVGSGLSMSTLLCMYGSYDGETELNLYIAIMQDATLKEEQTVDKDLIDSGGITGLNQRAKEEFENDRAPAIEGIGEWALIKDTSNGKSIVFAYGAYNVSILLNVFGGESGDNDAWISDKLTEAGMLAAERLEAIIG